MDASKIVFLTKDLMIQSNASSAASQADVSIQAIADLDDAISLVIGNTVGLLLVDLQMPGLDVTELIEKFSSLESPCRLIAFAQHVEEELIARARDGGFEAVLTRGQFSRNLPTIVKEFAATIPKT